MTVWMYSCLAALPVAAFLSSTLGQEMKKIAVALIASLLAAAAFAQASTPSTTATKADTKPATHKAKHTKKGPCVLDQSKVGDCVLQ